MVFLELAYDIAASHSFALAPAKSGEGGHLSSSSTYLVPL